MNEQEQLNSAKGFGIAAIITGFLVAPVGIILGHISLAKYKKVTGSKDGKPLAIIGLIAGYFITITAVLLIGGCSLIIMKRIDKFKNNPDYQEFRQEMEKVINEAEDAQNQ